MRICTITDRHDATANARLIATAPELLAALETLTNALNNADEDWFSEKCEGFDLAPAMAAISKAKGK